MNLTGIKSQALKDLEIAEGTTPGPWKYDYGNWQVESEHKDFYRNVIADWCGWEKRAELSGNGSVDPIDDFVFIAHSRTALPESARNVLKLIEALEKCREQRNEYAERFDDCLSENAMYPAPWDKCVPDDAEIEKILNET